MTISQHASISVWVAVVAAFVGGGLWAWYGAAQLPRRPIVVTVLTSLGPGVLLVGLSVALSVVLVRLRRTITMEPDGVRLKGRGWPRYLPAADIKVITTRAEAYRVSTQWYRGAMPISKLFAGLIGGRTLELLAIDDGAMPDRYYQRLWDGLSALPYGRLPKGPRARL